MPKDKSRKDTLLAVDIGNTSVDAAVFHNCGADPAYWEVDAHFEIPLSNTDSLAGELSNAFRAVPQGAVIGSVSGQKTAENAAKAVESAFGISPLAAYCGMKTGLEIAYKTPDTLGIDRLANAAALFAIAKRACIAVDLGTATTFDCVSSKGVYLGGSICAGIEAFRNALANCAPALPPVPQGFPPSLIGANTEDCIKSGTMFGYAKMIDAMARALLSEMKEEAEIVATGGFSSLLSGKCETVSSTDPLLTLKGLAVILKKNE